MPKRPTSTRNSSVNARMRLAVVPAPKGWTITGAQRKFRTYATQKEAEAAARDLIAGGRGGELVICGRDGRIKSVDSYVVGQASAKALNALEGIRMSKAMAADFKELDRRNLSPAQRREWLISKYGKTSS